MKLKYDKFKRRLIIKGKEGIDYLFFLESCPCYTLLYLSGAVAEWVRELALNEWRPDILPGRVRLPLRATLSSELWQFR